MGKRTNGSFVLGDLRAGRKKGSRDKLGRDFFQALSEDFAEHGADVIKTVRSEDPGLYLRIVASTMPKEFTVERVTSELSDDELDEMIIRERELIAKEFIFLGSTCSLGGGLKKERSVIRGRPVTCRAASALLRG